MNDQVQRFAKRMLQLIAVVIVTLFLCAWLQWAWGLWVMIPALYYTAVIFWRWLRSWRNWRKVKATTELDDIDKESELYNQ